MKKMLKTNQKNYGAIVFILFSASPLFMLGCRGNNASTAACAAPTAVNCGKWVQLGSGNGANAFQPFLMENTAQVTLANTNAVECANNSGSILVPSTSNAFTIEIRSPLVCSMTNAGSCVCTGSAYLPASDVYGNPPANPVIIGQYTVNLVCSDKNTGSTKTFVSTGGC